MSAAGTWLTVTVKVTKTPTGETPSASDVATEIRKRMEDVDLGTDWTIVSVSS